VTTAILHAAFIPFGPIKDVDIPLDHQTQKNRGFGFVTFEETCVRPESHQPYANQSNQSFGKIFWQPSTSSSHIPPVHARTRDHAFNTDAPPQNKLTHTATTPRRLWTICTTPSCLAK
jgi:hypothetical protein